MIYEYKGRRYPEYLKHGNMTQYIEPIARKFCNGVGLDVGAGRWPLSGAIPIDATYDNGDAMNLPERIGTDGWDYIYSSHLLEHLPDPRAALAHWVDRIRPGGVLFLYLPHEDMEYWLPGNCAKHLHALWPVRIRDLMYSVALRDVLVSERDLAWSFAAVGFKS